MLVTNGHRCRGARELIRKHGAGFLFPCAEKAVWAGQGHQIFWHCSYDHSGHMKLYFIFYFSWILWAEKTRWWMTERELILEQFRRQTKAGIPPGEQPVSNATRGKVQETWPIFTSKCCYLVLDLRLAKLDTFWAEIVPWSTKPEIRNRTEIGYSVFTCVYVCVLWGEMGVHHLRWAPQRVCDSKRS